MLLDICDKGKLICPVPTSCGSLISLKHVYSSWKNERISIASDSQPFPLFRKPGTGGEIFTLAEPALIGLVNVMFVDIGIPNDNIPFKIEFQTCGSSGGGSDKWESFTFVDQIRIAAILFQLNHEDAIKNKNGTVVNRVMNNHKILVSLKIADGKVTFEIRDITKTPMEVIPSKISVFDEEFKSLQEEEEKHTP
jgi:hypothetical protein